MFYHISDSTINMAGKFTGHRWYIVLDGYGNELKEFCTMKEAIEFWKKLEATR